MPAEISGAKRTEIKSKSVIGLPNTVTGKPDVVKNAIFDPVDIVVGEVNRIVGDTNDELTKCKNDITENGRLIEKNKTDIQTNAVNIETNRKNIEAAKIEINNAINNAIKSTLLNAHPVWEIYTNTESTSPASLFGGTWQQLTADAYFKIVTSGAGKLGGTSSHKMPAAALPNHTHPVYCVTSVNTSTTGNHALGTLHSGARNHDQYTLPNSDQAQQPYYPYYFGIYAWRRIG